MKFAVVILALVAAVSAQFNNDQYNAYNQVNRFSTPAPARYRPSSIGPTVTIAPAPFSVTPTPFSVTPTPFSVTPAPTRIPVRIPNVATNDYQAEILRFGNEISPDGSYNYFYETSNGIAAQEQGTPRNFGGNPPVAPVVAQGSYSYTSPEGVPVSISYIADENGFQPSGNVLPTPPPVPPQIARALEYIARTAPRQ